MSRGRPHSSQRLFAEDCTTLDMTQVSADVLGGILPVGRATLDVETTWWGRGSTYHRVELTMTRPHLGGRRWWFICPYCRRRVRKLYAVVKDRSFACRVCRALVYRSQYQKVPRSLEEMIDLTLRSLESLPTLRCSEVAILLGLTPRMIRYMARRGKIDYSICRKQRRFSFAAVKTALKERGRRKGLQTRKPTAHPKAEVVPPQAGGPPKAPVS